MDQEKLESTIAIDFGTTNSVACIWKSNRIETVPAYEYKGGKKLIPSFVLYENNKVTVGNAAKEKFGKENKFVVGAVKRIIGKKYEEYEKTKDDKSIFGCEFVKGDDGYPYFIVSEKGKTVSPIEVASEIFKVIKKRADEYGGRTYTQAYVSVPANFKNNQLKGIMMAAQMAGLKVLKFVTEPIAAVMSWCLNPENKVESGKRMLVYDFGGGTFDVSLIQYYESKGFEVMDTGGNPRLGGNDIDTALMKYLLTHYEGEDDSVINDIKNKRAKRNNYRRDCENLKILLTDCCTYYKESNDFYSQNQKVSFESQILKEMDVTAKMLDRAIEKEVNQTISIINNLLGSNTYFPNMVGYVFIVGGSSRLHLVRRLLEKTFTSAKFPTADDSDYRDEAVATGVMRLIYNDCSKDKKTIEEKLAVSYGVSTNEGVALILKKGFKLGTVTDGSTHFKPSTDYQRNINTTIYQWEGDPRDIKRRENGIPIVPEEDCFEVDKWSFQIDNPGKADDKEFGISFQLDSGCLLQVVCKDINENQNLSHQFVEAMYGGIASYYVCFIID